MVGWYTKCFFSFFSTLRRVGRPTYRGLFRTCTTHWSWLCRMTRRRPRSFSPSRTRKTPGCARGGKGVDHSEWKVGTMRWYMGLYGMRWGLTLYYIYIDIDMYMGGLCGLRSAIKQWKILESGTNPKPCWKMIWILQDSDMFQALQASRTRGGAFQCLS